MLREGLLEKQLTGHRVDRSIFHGDQVFHVSGPNQALPVIALSAHYLFQIVRDGVTIMACSPVEMPPLMGVEVTDEFRCPKAVLSSSIPSFRSFPVVVGVFILADSK